MLQEEIGIELPKRHTRDEMNLAEFPLTLLSTRSDPKIKTLEFKDQIRSRTGETINREWTITGADKFGLPTSSDDEILIGLLKLSVDQGFLDRKVHFTRYELLKVLQWTTEGRSYRRLLSALDRLSGVRIKAKNAFFDNVAKAHSTVNFGIIDAYEINDGRDIMGHESGASFFLWSEVLFKSFQVGYIKKLDLGFYLALKSAISKRMFRYLDKHFWYKSRLTMNVFTFAHEKLGVSRNYKFLSSLRQQLDPALDELIEAGFLAEYSYQGRGDNAEIVISSHAGKPRVLGANSSNEDGREERSRVTTTFEKSQEIAQGDFSVKKSIQSSLHSASEEERKRGILQDALENRGIKPSQAIKLLSGLTEKTLDKIAAIIEYYDELSRKGSRLISRSPVGFLYRAVENPESFNLPGEGNSNKQSEFSFGNKVGKNGSRGVTGIQSPVLKAKTAVSDTQSGVNDLKAKYLTARKIESKRLKIETEEKVIAKIHSEVEVALSKFKTNISETHFKEAVEHGVEERLLSLFAFPNFDEWTKSKAI